MVIINCLFYHITFKTHVLYVVINTWINFTAQKQICCFITLWYKRCWIAPATGMCSNLLCTELSVAYRSIPTACAGNYVGLFFFDVCTSSICTRQFWLSVQTSSKSLSEIFRSRIAGLLHQRLFHVGISNGGFLYCSNTPPIMHTSVMFTMGSRLPPVTNRLSLFQRRVLPEICETLSVTFWAP